MEMTRKFRFWQTMHFTTKSAVARIIKEFEAFNGQKLSYNPTDLKVLNFNQ
jgi:hypothetical protein